MGWTSAEVRAASLSDFIAAVDGFRDFHCAPNGDAPRMTRAEAEALRAELDEEGW